MANMTLAIPSDLRERMDRHPEIKWTEVIRMKLHEYLDSLEETDEIASSSLRARLGMGEGEITEEDLALASQAVALRDDD